MHLDDLENANYIHIYLYTIHRTNLRDVENTNHIFNICIYENAHLKYTYIEECTSMTEKMQTIYTYIYILYMERISET